MIKIVVLGSGSKGNSTYIDIDGRKFLIDCGFTRIATKKRLATIGRTIEEVEGVLVSHDHKDHTSPWLIKENMIIPDSATTPFRTFRLSHDAECTGYTATDKDGNKVGFISDTGCIPEEAIKHLFDCSIILVETNYSIDMLIETPYPIELQERIASETGHLRDECAGELVEMVAWEGLKFVVGMHLSSKAINETLARFELESAVREKAPNCEVIISTQGTPTKIMVVL